MKRPSLQVTYRRGRAFAAYYYLPRQSGDRSARTEPADGGMLIDWTDDNRPIGIEIPAPSQFSLVALNAVLRRLGLAPADEEEMAPLAKAA